MFSWILYSCTIVLRIVVGTILPGYLHPDEFFQGGQELFFGCPPMIPWEFHPHNAVRSMVFPTLMTWLPIKVYSLALAHMPPEQLGGMEMLFVPRISCALCSVFAVDLFVYLMTKDQQQQRSISQAAPTDSMWIVATAWPAWMVVTRPFTNGFETMFLSMILYFATKPSPSSNSPSSLQQSRNVATNIFIGVLSAMGLFTRFTFAFFALPVMLMYLSRHLSGISGINQIFLTCLGFLVTASVIVSIDASFYGDPSSWTSFVTPWNAFLYNSKIDNLQVHGIHPRWTHVGINMFMLFGPMTILFYGIQMRELIRKTRGEGDVLQIACRWTVISGLGFLSLAPHQEPRFLTPILVPLAIVVGRTNLWSSWKLRSLWISFNIILLVVFGILHQGGIIPAILSAEIIRNEPQSIIFHHTYMPPSFMSRRFQCTDDDDDGQVCSVTSCPQHSSSLFQDLMGSRSVHHLTLAINQVLHCDREMQHGNSHRVVHLVSPPQVMDGWVLASPANVANGNGCHFLLGAEFSCRTIWTHWPHLTTEDFPTYNGSMSEFIQSFGLSMYEISCQ